MEPARARGYAELAVAAESAGRLQTRAALPFSTESPAVIHTAYA
jgi:hypothetical protein